MSSIPPTWAEACPRPIWRWTDSMSPNRTKRSSGQCRWAEKKNITTSHFRIFTVILYMFSVSLGAILLSLYYVFLWKNPHTMILDNRVRRPKLKGTIKLTDNDDFHHDPGLEMCLKTFSKWKKYLPLWALFPNWIHIYVEKHWFWPTRSLPITTTIPVYDSQYYCDPG